MTDSIAAAKKDPGKLNYSTSGNGSAPHLGAALFSQLTGAQMTHIPYRAARLAIQSVMAGDTQLTFGTSPSVLPHGRAAAACCALAVSTRERSPLVPDLPGMKEAGLPDYNLEFWYGMFVPAGTPPAIVKKIYDATVDRDAAALGQGRAGARRHRGVAVRVARAVQQLPASRTASSGSTWSRAPTSRSSDPSTVGRRAEAPIRKHDPADRRSLTQLSDDGVSSPSAAAFAAAAA